MGVSYKLKLDETTYDATHTATVLFPLRLHGFPGDTIVVSLTPGIPFSYYMQWMETQSRVERVFGQNEVTRAVLQRREAGARIYPRLSKGAVQVYLLIPETSAGWDTGPYCLLNWAYLIG